MSSQFDSVQRRPEERIFAWPNPPSAPATPIASRQTAHANEAVDPEFEDLLYSWRRITDPKSRKIALDIIRAMAG